MEIAVKVTADRWDRAVPPTIVATTHLVMVAIDHDGKPRPVPHCSPRPTKTNAYSAGPKSGANTDSHSAALALHATSETPA